MNKRIDALPLSFFLLFLCMIISACGSSLTSQRAGLLTTSALPVKNTMLRTTSTLGNYAFVRNNQLWVSLHGAHPVQMTHLTYPKRDGMFWSQPLLFANGRYVAFHVMTGWGFGGGGCGYIADDGRSGALFVLDTTTHKVTEITVPGEKNLGADGSIHGYWEYLFSESTTHLLVWHSTLYDNDGGLYRYSFSTHALALVLPASKVPNAEKNGEAFAPMRYNNGQLYYETFESVPGSTQLYKHVIYRHSVTQPNAPTSRVLDAGTQVFCDVAHGNWGQYRETGWDISPDGQRLVVQKLLRNSQGKETSIIQEMSLRSGTPVTLFTHLSAEVLSHDLVVSWAPDNLTVLLQSPSQTAGRGTFYSADFTRPSVVLPYVYTTDFGTDTGHIFWKPDTRTFAFYVLEQYGHGDTSSVYTFTLGETHQQTLLRNATNFVWS